MSHLRPEKKQNKKKPTPKKKKPTTQNRNKNKAPAHRHRRETRKITEGRKSGSNPFPVYTTEEKKKVSR